MQQHTFVYNPLQEGEIRLLRLQWAGYKHNDSRATSRVASETTIEDREDMIECEMTNHRLSSSPRYIALSYTWGRDSASRRIKLNGKDILVRHNLYSFFRQLLCHANSRSDINAGTSTFATIDNDTESKLSPFPASDGVVELRTETYWWVDALCIDQNNISERNAQVTQMRRIFSQAHFIVIWLGPAADDSDLVMEAYQSYQSHIVAPRRARQVPPSELFLRRKKWLGSLPLDALWRLSQRPWWRRVWVWQEATSPLVPIELWCGAARVPFDVVYAANQAIGISRSSFDRYRHLHRGYNVKIYAMGQLSAARAGHGAEEINISPLWLLDEAMRLAASDPRDRVFALLPIWDEFKGEDGQQTVEAMIPVDYRLDVEEVFRLATIYILKQSPRQPNILRKCMCNIDGTFRRHSWVPDMSYEMVAKPWNLLMYDFAIEQHMAPNFDPVLKFSEDMTRISLRAHLADFVKQMHSPIAPNEDVLTTEPGPWEARYRTWISKLGKFAYPNHEDHPYAGGGIVSEAVDKLLAFNNTTEGVPIKHWPVLEAANSDFPAFPDAQTILQNGPSEFVYGFSCLSLIETQDGYLGTALPGVHVGDALVRIPGVPCLMIFRQEGNFWRIVGSANVVNWSDQKMSGPDMKAMEFVIT
ncbi:HET-domain-containing protein [Hypoxylon crocopeplum]|nr:HET-domain-containing protein [Hypoxylon crocopeplum]